MPEPIDFSNWKAQKGERASNYAQGKIERTEDGTPIMPATPNVDENDPRDTPELRAAVAALKNIWIGSLREPNSTFRMAMQTPDVDGSGTFRGDSEFQQVMASAAQTVNRYRQEKIIWRNSWPYYEYTLHVLRKVNIEKQKYTAGVFVSRLENMRRSVDNLRAALEAYMEALKL